MQDSIWLPSNWTTTSASEQKCSYVLGIDFGTSNSVVAIWRSDKGRVKIIKNSLEAKTTPSRITFHQDFDHYSIGRLASATATSTSHEISTRTIIGIKNLIGAESKTNFENRFSHLLEEIEDEENSNHVEIKKKVVVQCEDDQHHTRNYSPEELIALILSELRSNAIKYLQHIPMKDHGSEDVTALHRVVLGIPAHFTEKKKDCLRIAAQMAGFDEVTSLL